MLCAYAVYCAYFFNDLTQKTSVQNKNNRLEMVTYTASDDVR